MNLRIMQFFQHPVVFSEAATTFSSRTTLSYAPHLMWKSNFHS